MNSKFNIKVLTVKPYKKVLRFKDRYDYIDNFVCRVERYYKNKPGGINKELVSWYVYDFAEKQKAYVVIQPGTWVSVSRWRNFGQKFK